MCPHNIFILEKKTAPKACSGKCAGTGNCAGQARIWIVAACQGMLSLLEKDPDGQISARLQGGQFIASSVEDLRQHLLEAIEKKLFDQLVIIGSATDLAWVHLALDGEIAKRINAEIQYPLVSEWFKQTPEMPSLCKALDNILHA